ncbi:hypothetical protein LEAN103870_17625 [Legionella anisa]|uniref:DrrA phosphatidylinositol 4-phosphate binding domain-containing protein n=1 Tax=Legionella anisa TaxID=28082 RepID=A0AAX0WU45_9GAMM|nr:hypothetical protein [Legionella anisa]AWN74654.1 hypothetical protein DLD14_12850 [Legionella anisa]KTC77452.1 hypothetical protein Lani_0010 [Legionella anisa]MCW8425225.1 hypothetical protein [Legionella anisa]MCW8449345.1 hypothetical protein [Legionella anisa]PNL61450.1 hypothetical protein A6J39_009620 [Legionella anisa]
MPHPNNYRPFDPPNDKSPPPKVWAQAVLPDILALGRQKIALFNNFPPEYVDYYKALQEAIAKHHPDEQDRPLICLDIIGRKRKNERPLDEADPRPQEDDGRSPEDSMEAAPKLQEDDGREKAPEKPKVVRYFADIRMAGGTGPLSDATALENLVRQMSKIGHAPLNQETREQIAERMENFSGVMYSMPPPRDKKRLALEGRTYKNLYRDAREDLPCTSLHILTNTGHSNKWVFSWDLFLGQKKFGDVDDMTVKVARRIEDEARNNERVLILGTHEADKKKLYPNLLSNRSIEAILPTGKFGRHDAKLYLQSIIDQTKAGRVHAHMPGEPRTCGQAFVDFVVAYAKATRCTSLLFSCTELPMLLHTPASANQTYFDILKEELAKLNVDFKYYDTEELFVEEMATKSLSLQKHPEIRSTFSFRGESSTYHHLHTKLNEVRDTIEQHCHKFIGTKDEKQKQKRNVLMATLKYFDDGDLSALARVMKENPRYEESSTKSKTLELVSTGIHLMKDIEREKAKFDSFKVMREDLQEGRAQALENALPPDEGKEPYDDQAQARLA